MLASELSLVVRKLAFCIAKTKTQISFAVTAKLISAFVFDTRILQSLYYLNPKFQASSHLLYSPVCVGPGRKPQRQVFSQRGSVDTVQNGCQPRITAFDQAIRVTETVRLAVHRDYMAGNGLGRHQVFACMVYDWLGGQHR